MVNDMQIQGMDLNQGVAVHGRHLNTKATRATPQITVFVVLSVLSFLTGLKSMGFSWIKVISCISVHRSVCLCQYYQLNLMKPHPHHYSALDDED